MRTLLLMICFFGLAGRAHAQTFARAEATAGVRIPDFLSIRVAETTNISPTSRRVTVYVTANRAWQLSVISGCAGCTVSMQSREGTRSLQLAGRNGNEIPVVIEYEWQEGQTPPEATSLQYILTPA